MKIEYKGITHPIANGATPDQTAKAIAATYPGELDNYQLVLKEGTGDTYILMPKFGSKG